MSTPRTALVTGASRGIGLLTAKTLARRGHHVYAAMRDVAGRNRAASEELSGLATREGLALIPVELDVTDAAACATLVATIEAERPIDALVNNAGVMPVGVTEGFSESQMVAFFEVNMFGVARMSQAVLPAMRRRRNGLLIHLSSSAGRLAIPYFGVYCASKWAVEAYAEALHYELAPFGVQSVLVEPSGHATDLVQTAPAPTMTAVLDGYGAHAGARDKLLGMFKGLFSEGHAANDAQNVADRIAELVVMEGDRPLRTQVGDDMGVSAINEAVAPIQAGLIDQLSQVYAGDRS